MTVVLVTGAAGFIGRTLTRVLIEEGRLDGASGSAITRLTLADRAPTSPPLAPFEVRRVTTRLSAAELGALAHDADVIFHLAAALTLEAERDVSGGWDANLALPLALLEAARAGGQRPRVVFASSIAVFGPEVQSPVTEERLRTPRTSYGTAKCVVELLLADYTRRGVLDGRAVRLPFVLTRPGAPTSAASDLLAEVLRGPLERRTVVSPLDPDGPVAVVTVRRAAQGLAQVCGWPDEAFGATRAVHQPGLTVTPRQLVDALATQAGEDVAARVSFRPDPAVTGIVAGWPSVFASSSTPALAPDPDVDAVVAQAMRAFA
ncbi:NAD-dependent epimerase/dehydratase family protein [Acuticoccus sp.]|uniref:NAD-dependent epimerase/dehydratase family protein n=1 Tax=Acuticoccus sp. TaxID=1904378 RepID=UPI003B52F601